MLRESPALFAAFAEQLEADSLLLRLEDIASESDELAERELQDTLKEAVRDHLTGMLQATYARLQELAKQGIQPNPSGCPY